MDTSEQSEKQKRAAVYMRVSTGSQAGEDRHSLPIQEERARAFCNAHDYKLEEGHIYKDTISGATPAILRPDLKKLFDAASRGEFDMVIVMKMDRIARDLFEFLSIIRELKKYDINFCSITESVDTSTIFGQLAVNIAGAFAEFERGMIRERTMGGKVKAAETGKWVTGIPPFGFSLNKESRHLEVNPAEAKVVRQIFSWLIDDKLSLAEIERRMNAKKTPAPYSTKIKKRETNNYWYKRTIDRILTNEVYGGTFHYRKYKRPFKNLNSVTDKRLLRPRNEWIEMHCEAIVSKDLIEAAKKQLLQNRERASRNRKREYLYSRLIYCSECNFKMFGGFQPPRKKWEYAGGRYYHGIYRKDDAVGTSKRCGWCPQYSEARLEPIWECLKEILQNPRNMLAPLEKYVYKSEDPTKALRRIEEIKAEVTQLQEKCGRAKELYIENKVSKQQYEDYEKTYMRDIEKLQDEEVSLQQTLLSRKEKKDREEFVRKSYETIKAKLNDVSYEDKARIISFFVDRITLHAKDDYAEVVFKFPGSAETKQEKIVSLGQKAFPLVLKIKTISEKDRRAFMLRVNPGMYVPKALV